MSFTILRNRKPTTTATVEKPASPPVVSVVEKPASPPVVSVVEKPASTPLRTAAVPSSGLTIISTAKSRAQPIKAAPTPTTAKLDDTSALDCQPVARIDIPMPKPTCNKYQSASHNFVLNHSFKKNHYLAEVLLKYQTQIANNIQQITELSEGCIHDNGDISIIKARKFLERFNHSKQFITSQLEIILKKLATLDEAFNYPGRSEANYGGLRKLIMAKIQSVVLAVIFFGESDEIKRALATFSQMFFKTVLKVKTEEKKDSTNAKKRKELETALGTYESEISRDRKKLAEKKKRFNQEATANTTEQNALAAEIAVLEDAISKKSEKKQRLIDGEITRVIRERDEIEKNFRIYESKIMKCFNISCFDHPDYFTLIGYYFNDDFYVQCCEIYTCQNQNKLGLWNCFNENEYSMGMGKIWRGD